jgi:hypothetical protein
MTKNQSVSEKNIYQKMRESYDIEMSTLSKLLGFGINQWRIYEHEEKPVNPSHDLLISLIQDPFVFRKVLSFLKLKTETRDVSNLDESKKQKTVEMFYMGNRQIMTTKKYNRTLYAVNNIIANIEQKNKIIQHSKLAKVQQIIDECMIEDKAVSKDFVKSHKKNIRKPVHTEK